MFKKLLCFSAAFILILTSFCIPSFAYFPSDQVSPMPIILNPSGNISSDNFIYLYSYDADNYRYGFSSTNQYYVTYVDEHTSRDQYKNSTYIFTVNSNDTFYLNTTATAAPNPSSIAFSNFRSESFGATQTTNGLYYSKMTSYSQASYNLTSSLMFSSFSEAEAAVKNYIDNPPSPLPNDGFDGTLTIPAGNVAYIQINGGDMELSAVMNSKSGLIMGGNAWANNARISYGVSDYPSSGITFPISGSDLIPWMKQAQGQDLLGRTRYAGYPRTDLTTSDNYIVIYNPASSSLASQSFNDGEDDINPSITAHFSKLVTYRIYPLTQSYNVQTNELTSNSISDYDDYFNGIPDENGDFTETPSSPGMPSQAQPGGTGGLSDSSQSIGDYIRNITNILSNFVNNVIALIQVPISHIGQLIDSGSGFMSALRGLYAWLPVDIQGLVISALTVVIGIGVFKVFL